MAIIGYARVSSINQNLDSQINILVAEGCERIFKEKISGKNTDRPELHRMLDFVRDGDVIIVKEISRLARSALDLYLLVEKIKRKGCQIRFLKENLDTTTVNGRLIFGIFASLAEFERGLIRDRQREGIEVARLEGKRLGRPALKKPDNFDVMLLKVMEGKLTAVQAFKLMGISKSRFYVLRKKFIETRFVN